MIDEYSRFPWAFPCADMTASTVIKCLVELFSIFGLPQFIHSDRGSQFMSEELKTFLHGKGIATSRSTPYNPRGNGQVERLNNTIWKATTLSLKSKGLATEQWELGLTDALHSVRSLLCTETNATPHERMFQHSRRSTNGNSLPSWLLSPGPVYYKRHVRNSKYDPVVDEVELLEANPQYAQIRLPDGRESTVALRHLAPIGNDKLNDNSENSVPPTLDPMPTQTSPELVLSDPAPSSPDHEEMPSLVQSLEEPQVSQPSPEVVKKTPFVRTSTYNLRSGPK